MYFKLVIEQKLVSGLCFNSLAQIPRVASLKGVTSSLRWSCHSWQGDKLRPQFSSPFCPCCKLPAPGGPSISRLQLRCCDCQDLLGLEQEERKTLHRKIWTVDPKSLFSWVDTAGPGQTKFLAAATLYVIPIYYPVASCRYWKESLNLWLCLMGTST